MNIKHGHTRKGQWSPEYRCYNNAKTRCTNPNTKSWKDYGGRGIRFLFRNFQEFLAAIGLRPSPRFTLGRLNNDGHYEIGNVVWQTRSEQSKNRRTYGGWHLSEKIRQEISKRQKGKKNSMFGKHHNEETRQKLSNALKGNKQYKIGICVRWRIRRNLPCDCGKHIVNASK